MQSNGIRTTLSLCARRLEAAGADAPRLCAELLLARALGVERHELLKRLLLEPDLPLEAAALARLEALAERRSSGEPAAYILGKKEFYGRDFLVSPAVLIPRPETELIIDLARRFAAPVPSSNPLFIDLGAGSGCIGITLALELPGWRGLCLEKSAPAASCALANARKLSAPGLAVIRGDFAAAPLPDACLDLVAANPPYVSEKEYAGLAREVLCEPKNALVPSLDGPRHASGPAASPGFGPATPLTPGPAAGPVASPAASPGPGPTASPGPGPAANPTAGHATGLEDPLRVLAEAARLLKSGGLLLMEMGCTQGQPLLGSLSPSCWRDAVVEKDLAGLDRILRAIRR